MTKPITINQFQGMDNVRESDGDPRAPQVVLNADPTPEGSLRQRKGLRLVVPLPDAHSLWPCRDYMLCMSQGSLYRLDNSGPPLELSAIPGSHDLRMYYALDAARSVWMSNGIWQGVYRDDAVESWAEPAPVLAPMCVIQDGGLKAGLYRVLFVPVDGDVVHSPGPWAEYDLPEGKSLFITNRPSDCEVAITDPDGHIFYLQGYVDRVMVNENSSPLPTFGCVPFPAAKFLRPAFGRMWGAVANQLIYSEPYRFDLTRVTSYMEFSRDITMVAPANGGLYVGTIEDVHFLAGQEPNEMSRRLASSAGAVPGQQAWITSLPNLGNHVPVWGCNDGTVVMAGSHDGTVVPLAKGRARAVPGEQCSVVEMPGQPTRILASMRRSPSGSGMGMGDNTTCEVVRNGKIISAT